LLAVPVLAGSAAALMSAAAVAILVTWESAAE